jgi:hypothetical protein
MKNKIVRWGLMIAGIASIFLTLPTNTYAQESHYSYTYDYWGDVQECPDVYSVAKVFTFKDLGLEKNIRGAESLFVKDNLVYLCDTGNNRILVLERTGTDGFELVKEFDSVKGVEPANLASPSDIAVSDDGYMFIADRGNQRILKVDMDLNYVMQFDAPVDSTLASDYIFQPDKIVIDTAGRVYCSAIGINKGLIKYEADGVFTGFIGATPVSYNFTDYLWKKFASQAQRARMDSFVPTEYDNVYMDKEGFVYACTGKVSEDDLDSEKVDAVRKINMLGTDILVRNGDYPIYGDLYWGGKGGISGPSYFKDVTVLDNDVYVCLDQNRGRLFGYDDQGRMVFAFGGNGNMDGYFRKPVSVEHMGNDLIVLDTMDCAITLFITTEFGELIFEAMDQFDHGLYDEAQASWEQVKLLNGNYTLAYIGIGRSLLRKGQYKEAMKYFELKYDDENYSKAYQQYRKGWIKHNIAWIVAVIVLLFLVPLTLGKIKKIRYEIDIADIFKV